MKIHVLQNESGESPGIITKWALTKRHEIKTTMLYEIMHFPETTEYDMLVIMGGPMNVYEEDIYPFLVNEKIFIRNAIEQNKKVLGICLGAQLIACVLGAEVRKNKFMEIGWHEVRFTNDAWKMESLKVFPNRFMAFHWHGDTFDIPEGAVRIAESDACQNQGFVYGNNVCAFQFHPEADIPTINGFIKTEGEIMEDSFVQNSEKIKSNNKYTYNMNNYLEEFLEKF